MGSNRLVNMRLQVDDRLHQLLVLEDVLHHGTAKKEQKRTVYGFWHHKKST